MTEDMIKNNEDRIHYEMKCGTILKVTSYARRFKRETYRCLIAGENAQIEKITIYPTSKKRRQPAQQ
jgi:hypothetical protein